MTVTSVRTDQATSRNIESEVQDEIAFVRAAAEVLRVASYHGFHELGSEAVAELLGKIGDSMEHLDGLVGPSSSARIVRTQ